MKDLSWINSRPPFEKEKFLNGPAMKPPPNTLPKFENPPNKSSVGIGLCIYAGVVSTLLVLLRVYSRGVYHRRLNVEDLLAVGALAVFGGCLFCTWKVTIYPGFFVHQWDVRVKDLPHVLYYLNVGLILYGIVMILLKSGILLEWARIFVPRGTRNSFWWICYITLALNILFYTASTFLDVFGCNPPRKLWIPTLPGKCLNTAIINIASASLNFCLDIIILVLPQRVIWGLHMSMTKKSGVAMLFAVGIFACVAAGVRVRVAIDFERKEDILYNSSILGVWSIAEIISGFLIFCIPSMPKLFLETPWVQKILSKIKSITKSQSRKIPSAGGYTFAFGQLRKHRADPDESLFTDSDQFHFIPLNDITVTSEIQVHSERMRENESFETKRLGLTLPSE